MDLKALESAIANEKINLPIYVFTGPETFLKEKTFEKMSSKLIPKPDRRDNTIRFVCTANGMNGLINQIFSLSFNPSPRFFALINFDSIPAASRKKFLTKLQQASLPPATFLVFFVNDYATSEEICKKFKKLSDKITFWAPFANQLPAWIKTQARELGAEIAGEASDLLIDLTGGDLGTMHQELVKLAQTNDRITAAHVKDSVSYLKQDTIFDFLDAFGSRNLKRALKCVESLTHKGEPAQKIWFMLCRQLREFRLMHELAIDRPDIFSPVMNQLEKLRSLASRTDFKSNQAKKNCTAQIQRLASEMPEHLTRVSGLRQPVKIRNLSMALNFSHRQILKTWPQLIEIDLLFKSGAPDPRTTLQKFIVDFLSRST